MQPYQRRHIAVSAKRENFCSMHGSFHGWEEHGMVVEHMTEIIRNVVLGVLKKPRYSPALRDVYNG
jgi:hypothetical protein